MSHTLQGAIFLHVWISGVPYLMLRSLVTTLALPPLHRCSQWRDLLPLAAGGGALQSWAMFSRMKTAKVSGSWTGHGRGRPGAHGTCKTNTRQL